MLAASFLWRKAPTTRRSTGSSRSSAASCCSTACMCPKRLARTIRQGVYEIRIDSDFDGVIDGCAASRAGRRTTWINRKIRGLYRDLFDAGYCHTVEAWAGGRMVGGLYGVALNGAFFGESMFSTARDASKVALVYLCARLIHGRLLAARHPVRHRAPEAVRHRRDRSRRVSHAAREGARPHRRLPRSSRRCEPAARARHHRGRALRLEAERCAHPGREHPTHLRRRVSRSKAGAKAFWQHGSRCLSRDLSAGTKSDLRPASR